MCMLSPTRVLPRGTMFPTISWNMRSGSPCPPSIVSTATTFGIDGQLPLCEGIARTRTTNSEALANSWFERHRFNEAVGVLHDPNGPGVKIVGEPAYLVYPWRETVGVSAW